MRKSLPLLVVFIAISGTLFFVKDIFFSREGREKDEFLAEGFEKKEAKLDMPDEFALFERGIRTKEGESGPNYEVNYAIKELTTAKANQKLYYAAARLNETNAVTWTERGPANVPGRTRALAVLPDDPTHNTWIAGSVGGGIWKTTDGGSTWVEKTKELPNIAFSSIAMAESNPLIVYAGSGEGGLGGSDYISGNGLFKSVDGGETWIQVSSTADNFDFHNINRVIVDPNNADIVLICTSNTADFESGIYKSVDGGASWSNTYLDNTTSRGIQQIVATPGNFSIQYASSNGIGVLKSVDAGNTWQTSNTGMSPNGRIEIAVSPVNVNRVWASMEGSSSGSGSDLYISDDAGVSWSLVDVSFNSSSVDYLGGQGWYDHTVLCSPYNADIVYLGGVLIVQVTLGSGGANTITNYNVEENGTDAFMTFVNFGASGFGGALEIGDFADGTSVELRFGPGLSQKAHRFTVPDGEGSGVPDANYMYQDYVDVPFEVWDIDNNRQLMVSFRDQQDDGVFNLLEQNTTEGDEANHSREYVYIENVDYNATTPDANIAVDGGHVFNEMYFFWPILPAGATWDAGNLPSSTLSILSTTVNVQNATTTTVADAYSDLDGKNSGVHPDHHNLFAIKEDDTNETFRILLSGDGGPYISEISDNPGVTEGDWTAVGNSYNTSQFYGADKKPGEDKYIGGMQDNGTWVSPLGADESSNYAFKIGGDGFEVLWNSLDENLVIGGSQYNGFRRSNNGGGSFTDATNGLSGDAPFISKLATSRALPDIIYAVSSDGVFKSVNFGTSWELTPINQFWESSSYTFLDVDVSKANANIVWAGSGMTSTRKIHVSTDQGETFTPVENYQDIPVMGTITKLATHPTEPNTAYVLFSFARGPKILKTEDLGETWTDISGYGTNSTSSNGFPDVAVYCLYVRPDDPNILWAGTDIGIVESVDNGVSWHLLDNDMPKVAIWDMKGQDDQVIIATHGRGIWTATIDASQISYIKASPTITAYGTSPRKELSLAINVTDSFDSTEVWVDGLLKKTFYSIVSGDYIFKVGDVDSGNKQVKLISYSNGAPIQSNQTNVEILSLVDYTEQHSNFFKIPSDFSSDGLEVTDFLNTQNGSLQSSHNYSSSADLTAILTQPIIVSGTNSTFNYEDIALVEPTNDYVVIEATKDGLNWSPIADSYDASSNTNWQTAFSTGGIPTDYSLFVQHSVNLTDNFAVQDTLLFRFRLHSTDETTGWGWAVDNLYIQMEPLGVEQAKEVTAFSVYPIPSKGEFTIDYQLTSASGIEVQITDMSGRKVKLYDLGNKPAGSFRFKFDNYKLERGTYLVSLKTKSGVESKRVIIE